MNTNEALERMVSDRMAIDAAGYRSDRGLDDALAATSRMRPYPQWLALFKEPPMRIPSRVVVGSPTFRLVSIFVLTLAVAIVGIAGVVAAASLMPDKRLPDPYGPASNGAIAYEFGGDIYLADADGSNGHVIVDGPAMDVAPWFSRDGSHLAYVHDPEGDEVLMVANADGTGARAVMSHPWCMDFMPDGTRLAGTRLVDGERRLSVVDITTGVADDIDLGSIVPSDWCPAVRPPDGQEVVFTGWPTLGSSNKGIYAVSTDGSSLPRLIGALATNEAQPEGEGSRPGAGDSISFQDMQVSPDGRTIAYWSWEPSELRGGDLGPSLHQLDLASGAELSVPIGSGETGGGLLPHYLPDSSSLVFEGDKFSGSGQYLFAVPRDGGSPSVPVGPTYPLSDRQGFDISPDGTTVLFTTRAGATRLVELATGAVTPLDGLQISPESMPSWQRLALTP